MAQRTYFQFSKQRAPDLTCLLKQAHAQCMFTKLALQASSKRSSINCTPVNSILDQRRFKTLILLSQIENKRI